MPSTRTNNETKQKGGIIFEYLLVTIFTFISFLFLQLLQKPTTFVKKLSEQIGVNFENSLGTDFENNYW